MKINKCWLILFLVILKSCSTSKNNTSGNEVKSSAIKTNAALVETYWRLSELMGQPVVNKDNNKEIFMIINSKDNKVHGFSGCNTFNGMYSLTNETRISFSKCNTTLMACIDMSNEKELMEVLEKTDSYAIQEDTLTLNRARMAPLAKFTAVINN